MLCPCLAIKTVRCALPCTLYSLLLARAIKDRRNYFDSGIQAVYSRWQDCPFSPQASTIAAREISFFLIQSTVLYDVSVTL